MNLEYNSPKLIQKNGLTFHDGEILKWTGKPNMKSYLINEINKKFVGIISLVVLMIFAEILALMFKTTYTWEQFIIFFLIVAFVSSLFSINKILNLFITTYIITNNRIITFEKNFRDSKYKIIQIKDIQSKELNRTSIDKYFHTATIQLYTGEISWGDHGPEKKYSYIDSINEFENAFNSIMT